MSSLRTLDLSENSVRELPRDLALARTLEVCVCTRTLPDGMLLNCNYRSTEYDFFQRRYRLLAVQKKADTD
jgi:hypothetical protein